MGLAYLLPSKFSHLHAVEVFAAKFTHLRQSLSHVAYHYLRGKISVLFHSATTRFCFLSGRILMDFGLQEASQ